MAVEVEYERPQRALDVLSGVLVEPYSDEDVINAARVWEDTYGAILLYPSEEDQHGNPKPEFFQRLAEFKPNVKRPAISGDPAMFREELRRRREAIDDPSTLTASQKARINELEEALDEQLTDFTKLRTRKQIIEDAKKRYAEYQQQPDFAKRTAMIKREKDPTTLQLLYKYDKSESVRQSAMERIAELEVVRA